MDWFFEQVPLAPGKTFLVTELQIPYLAYPIHYHPQYELTLVIEGWGKRFVGDSIEDFGAGDLCFMAPNLPHQLRHPKEFKDGSNTAHVMVIQIHEHFLGPNFELRTETAQLKRLLDDSKRGIVFTCKDTIDKVHKSMKRLQGLDNLEAIIELLNLMNILARAADYRLLASTAYTNTLNVTGFERIRDVFHYILDNYTTDEITLDTAANIAKLEKSAFSHYFKRRTGKTFSEFMNDLRIGHVCKLLIESDLDIAEICFKSGFNNLSYFNRRFKERYMISPVEYRKQFRKDKV